MVDSARNNGGVSGAPEGTITVTLVALAVVTLARVAPKNTMLLLGAVLKLVPLGLQHYQVWHLWG